jgi:hypothetical protein
MVHDQKLPECWPSIVWKREAAGLKSIRLNPRRRLPRARHKVDLGIGLTRQDLEVSLQFTLFFPTQSMLGLAIDLFHATLQISFTIIDRQIAHKFHSHTMISDGFSSRCYSRINCSILSLSVATTLIVLLSGIHLDILLFEMSATVSPMLP